MMKKSKLLFLIVIFHSSCVIAQHYQPIHSGKISYFIDQYGSVKSIRIDSVEFKTDSVLHPVSNIQQKEFNCVTPYGTSWIGKKVIIQSNGLTVFLNIESDSVKIKTIAILNESWTAYRFPDSSTVVATVINSDTLSFLGLVDSVKTIGFKVFDKKMNPLSHMLNSMHIIISKSYGLVKTLNFSMFPGFDEYYYYQDLLQEYTLAGLSAPKLGIQNLEWYDVNDFQIGDELHVRYESSEWYDPAYKVYDLRQTIYKYLGRKENVDSIVYTIERTQSRKQTAIANTTYTYIHDTIESIIKPWPLFEELPGEVIISDNWAYTLSMNADTIISKTIPSYYSRFHAISESCWSDCCADGCFPTDTYFKGLGGPYYECENFGMGGGITNKLVFYKKGSERWGMPLVITSVKEYSIDDKIDLYPNPAKNRIYITVQNLELPIILEIVNMEGQVLIVGKVDSNSSSVNIENLKSGIYIYRFSKNGERVKTGKLIIE
jgi:hypothetical protein